MDENDALGTASPTRPAPHPAPAGPGDGVHGASRGDAHPGDLRYADLDRLARFLRRVPQKIRDRINALPPGHVYDPHTWAAAGSDPGDGDTVADVRTEGNGGGDSNMPSGGPERPRPYLLRSNHPANATDCECRPDPQTAADLWNNTSQRLPDEGGDTIDVTGANDV